jgi:hypothetical protein
LSLHRVILRKLFLQFITFVDSHNNPPYTIPNRSKTETMRSNEIQRTSTGKILKSDA